MGQEEEKIIKEIKDFFSDHQERYEEGTWEEFRIKYEKRYKSRVKFLHPLSIKWKAVAAAAVLLVVLMQYFRGDVSERTETINTETVEENFGGRKTPQTGLLDDGSSKTERELVDMLPTMDGKSMPNYLEAEHTAQPIIADIKNQEMAHEDKDTAIKKAVAPNLLEGDRGDFRLMDDSAAAPLPAIAGNEWSNNKWKFGLELSTSVISEKLNFAAGAVAEFRLTNRISLSAGVTYAKIDAANALTPIEVSSSIRKTGVESTIEALDIPLSIIYHVNEALYASVGLSSFAVLDERKSFLYETEIVSEHVNINLETGEESISYVHTTQEYSQPTLENDFRPYTNMGYLNFSVGRRQNLYNGADLLFEPFLKVPLTDLSKGDIKMTNGGIKLKIMF